MDLEKINRNSCKVTKQRNIVVSFDRSDYENLSIIAQELSMHVSVLARGVLLTFLEEYAADQKEAE